MTIFSAHKIPLSATRRLSKRELRNFYAFFHNHLIRCSYLSYEKSFISLWFSPACARCIDERIIVCPVCSLSMCGVEEYYLNSIECSHSVVRCAIQMMKTSVQFFKVFLCSHRSRSTGFSLSFASFFFVGWFRRT